MRIFTLVLFAALLAGRLPAADIRPLDLSSGANSAFADGHVSAMSWFQLKKNTIRPFKAGYDSNLNFLP